MTSKMTGKVFGVLFVFFFLLLGLSIGCSPNGPTKVDKNHPLPGPGEGVRASTQSWGVFEGDCIDDPSACSREIAPTDDPTLQMSGKDKTYILNDHRQRFTVHLCVAHPEVPGRKIGVTVSAFLSSRQTGVVDEGEPSRKSPICLGVSSDMITPTGGVTNADIGEANFYESSQDLFTPTQWKVTLGFRVVR